MQYLLSLVPLLGFVGESLELSLDCRPVSLAVNIVKVFVILTRVFVHGSPSGKSVVGVGHSDTLAAGKVEKISRPLSELRVKVKLTECLLKC